VTTTPKVLIVDDDPDIRDLLSFSFGVAGFEIHTALDGRAALDVVEAHRPDLVVLDWMMPELDGLEVCRLLRSFERDEHLPVVMLSARTSAQDKRAGEAAGVTEYVTKPFSPRDLVRRCEQMLSSGAAASRRPAHDASWVAWYQG
jgi:DNA-binding response OmpR family regulator